MNLWKKMLVRLILLLMNFSQANKQPEKNFTATAYIKAFGSYTIGITVINALQTGQPYLCDALGEAVFSNAEKQILAAIW